MFNNQEVWFIVNFFSGTLNGSLKNLIIEEIKRYPNVKIFYTEYPKHATFIAQKAINEGVMRVVAVGGDGTINEIAAELRGTSVQLALLPIGSGNGLARHLKIPLEPMKAIRKAFNGKIHEIDTCTINGIPFFCTAGVGFDAQVATNFHLNTKRGFLTYIITSVKTMLSYKPKHYSIIQNGKEISQKAFAITFANASQYGNDAVIAPNSKIDDGLIDMVILKPFPLFYVFVLGIRLFTNSYSKSNYVKTVQAAELRLKSTDNTIIHFDGEPMQLNTNELLVKVDNKKLKVIV
jgi:diacylglycerol kinase (ATP)